MSRRKSEMHYDPVVECPFCKKKVRAKSLADHAKRLHTDDTNFTKKSPTSHGSLLEGVQVQNPDLAKDLNQLVVDESGILINPNQLQEEEHRKSREERWKNIPVPNRISSKPEDYAPKRTFQSIAGKNKKMIPGAPKKPPKTIDDAYREKGEWLEDIIQLSRLSDAIEKANNSEPTAFLECPLCGVEVKSARLRKHLAKAHPSISLPDEQIEKLQKNGAGNISNQQKESVKKASLGWKNTQVGARAFRQSLKKERERGLERVSNTVDNKNSHQEADLVKCPLCKHRTQYNVLFVHIQVSHPEVNPKIVMSRFNRVNRSRDYANLSRHQDELNELVKDYERLKQGQDESRDGGKYMGHMRRERGKFGSLPLYDDYSDESDAE